MSKQILKIAEAHLSAAQDGFGVTDNKPAHYVDHVTASSHGEKTAFIIMDVGINTAQLKALEAKGGKVCQPGALAISFLDAGGTPDDTRTVMRLADQEVYPVKEQADNFEAPHAA